MYVRLNPRTQKQIKESLKVSIKIDTEVKCKYEDLNDTLFLSLRL